MPELPEVENIKRGLVQDLTGERVSNVIVSNYQLRTKIPSDFSLKLINKRINSITRRAKYIVLTLDNGLCLLIHLGMTGKLILAPSEDIIQNKHTHVIFFFENEKILLYNDIRKFGSMELYDNINNIDKLNNIGVEPLSDALNGEYLYDITKKISSNIKSFIMNQQYIAGIGNIYASEILFNSRINPQKSCLELSRDQIFNLVHNIKKIIELSIHLRGTTIKDYVDSSGEKGGFQNVINVYGREGRVCFLCNGIIEKIKQAGRSSFYCPNCQRC